MNIPKKIKIGGLFMDVVEDKHFAGSNREFGNCDHLRGVITLDASQPDDHKGLTLIHEIIEKINQENELDLEHWKITNLTNALYGVIVDNKGLFSIIGKEKSTL